jgi:hypothetical protein
MKIITIYISELPQGTTNIMVDSHAVFGETESEKKTGASIKRLVEETIKYAQKEQDPS